MDADKLDCYIWQPYCISQSVAAIQTDGGRWWEEEYTNIKKKRLREKDRSVNIFK